MTLVLSRHRLAPLALAIGLFGAVTSMSGCATYKTIATAEVGTAKVFSGTRLNAAALHGDELSPRRFKTAPPDSPAIDLPFSLALDVVMLPLTMSSALYEVAFH